jgi:hypothetical protein
MTSAALNEIVYVIICGIDKKAEAEWNIHI